ncbi:MAG TPA: DUF4388 domain-containing protein [Pyrinomonadaceae bacterium]|nr:DUF4388 domain-containing protein [Pyrinomonadaceae bacterium]
MALTGQLSDMSLAELIEFFCNQRKTGRLKVDYHRGHGVFFIKEGELVDAKLGQLSGPEAVYFALTLPNAAFDFSPEVLPTRRTIDIAWTQVVLEGLRRLDEGLSPSESDAFGGWSPTESDLAMFMDHVDRLGESQQQGNGRAASKGAGDSAEEAAPLSMMVDGASAGGGKKKWIAMGAAACVLLAVAAVAVPVLRGSKSAAKTASPAPAAASSESSTQTSSADAQATAADTSGVSTDAPPAEESAADASADAARREREERERRLREQRERERRAEEQAKKADANQDATASAATPAAAPAASGPKSVRVSVTYDEAGRVTAASVAGASPGAEAYAGTAVRVARGRRFPAGKAGSTVITIPVN